MADRRKGARWPVLVGRLLLRLCRLGERRDDAIADMQELYDRRVEASGEREAGRRFVADAWSLLVRPRGLTSGVRSDLRDASRALGRTPVQTSSLFLCLLLGMTLTVAMMSVVNAIIAGDLPGIEDRGRLVRLTSVRRSLDGGPAEERRSIAIHHYQALPAQVAGTSGTAFQIKSVFGSASVQGTPVRLSGQFVNGAFFATLGTRPALGRMLRPSDDRADAPPVAVIGFSFWQRQFGGSEAAIGRTLGIGPHVVTVVGVTPRGFGGIGNLHVGDLGGGARDGGDVWLPVAFATWGRDALVMGTGGAAGGTVVFRLAAGEAPDAIRAGLAPVAAALDDRAAASAGRFAGFDVEPFALTEAGTDGASLFGGAALLMATPLLVLLIACTNVAGVQVSRALRRTGELATRVALGATRGQIARLIALETGMVALAAALAAWFLTGQILRLAEGVLPVGLARDSRVFAFAIVLTLGVTLAAGLAPAWRATGFRVIDGLQQNAGAGPARRVAQRRRVVLAAQIALSVALLGVSLHLARAIAAVPGALAPRHSDVLVASLRMFDLDMTEAERAAAWARLDDLLPAIAGIDIIATGSPLLGQENWGAGSDRGHPRAVSLGWFEATRTRLLAGRLPGPDEPDALVVNETLARRLGGIDGAIGTTVTAGGTPATVIGVIDDGYERVAWGRRVAVGYRVTAMGDGRSGDTLYFRGPGASDARQALLATLAGVHPQLAPYELGTIAELVDRQLTPGRVATAALGWMSVAAVVLAAVGLFGAIAQSATVRLHEFGVRLALGARRHDVAGLIVREALLISGIGLVLGAGGATLAASALQSGMLETISPSDPVPALGVCGAVVAIAAMAALVPVRRVMAIDPVKTLRGD